MSSSLSPSHSTLYRSLRNLATRIPQYNFREHALRRLAHAYSKKPGSPDQEGLMIHRMLEEKAQMQRIVRLYTAYNTEPLVIERPSGGDVPGATGRLTGVNEQIEKPTSD